MTGGESTPGIKQCGEDSGTQPQTAWWCATTSHECARRTDASHIVWIWLILLTRVRICSSCDPARDMRAAPIRRPGRDSHSHHERAHYFPHGPLARRRVHRRVHRRPARDDRRGWPKRCEESGIYVDDCKYSPSSRVSFADFALTHLLPVPCTPSTRIPPFGPSSPRWSHASRRRRSVRRRNGAISPRCRPGPCSAGSWRAIRST